jgi:hypothetical protein
MKDFKEFLETNKEKIYQTARKNTKLNSEGKPTISKDDDWFNEDEWDSLFQMSSKEALKDVTPIDWPEDVLTGKRKVIVS